MKGNQFPHSELCEILFCFMLGPYKAGMDAVYISPRRVSCNTQPNGDSRVKAAWNFFFALEEHAGHTPLRNNLPK